MYNDRYILFSSIDTSWSNPGCLVCCFVLNVALLLLFSRGASEIYIFSLTQSYLHLYKVPQFASNLAWLFSMEKIWSFRFQSLHVFWMLIACIQYSLTFILVFSFYLGILVSGWQWIELTWSGRRRGQVQALRGGVLAPVAADQRGTRAPAVAPGGMEAALGVAVDRREGGWPYQQTPVEARVIGARTWPQRLWREVAHYGSAMLVVHVRSVVYIEFVVANGTLAMRWFSLDLKQGLREANFRHLLNDFRAAQYLHIFQQMFKNFFPFLKIFLRISFSRKNLEHLEEKDLV